MPLSSRVKGHQVGHTIAVRNAELSWLHVSILLHYNQFKISFGKREAFYVIGSWGKPKCHHMEICETIKMHIDLGFLKMAKRKDKMTSHTSAFVPLVPDLVFTKDMHFYCLLKSEKAIF